MRAFIIAAVIFFVVLLFAFSKWKKKYGHSYRPSKGGTKGTGKGDLLSQIIPAPTGKGNKGIRSTTSLADAELLKAEAAQRKIGLRPKKTKS